MSPNNDTQKSATRTTASNKKSTEIRSGTQ
jgi:hypothetical protein